MMVGIRSLLSSSGKNSVKVGDDKKTRGETGGGQEEPPSQEQARQEQARQEHDEEEQTQNTTSASVVAVDNSSSKQLPTKSQQWRGRHWKQVALVIVVMVILIVLAIVLSVVLTNKNKNKTKSASNDINAPPPSNTTGTQSNEDGIISCSNDDAPIDVSEVCEASVKAVDTLQNAAPFPAHLEDNENFNPVLQDGDFDVAVYLDVLDHLSLVDDEHVLEYVYQFDGMGGHPILYVRHVDEAPFRTAQEYREKACVGGGGGGADNDSTAAANTCPDYLNKVRTDGTPQGYMQLATLDVMDDQFYLWWHANYNDHQIIYDDTVMDQILREYGNQEDVYCLECFSDQDVALLQSMDVAPTVTYHCDDDTKNEQAGGVVQVRFITFTKWGGFFRRKYTIARGEDGGVGTEKILKREMEELVPYYYGIAY